MPSRMANPRILQDRRWVLRPLGKPETADSGAPKKNSFFFDLAIDPFMRDRYMHHVPSGTMAINAHVISGSDPGAVPGGSTRNLLRWGRMRGRNRIDERVKVFAFARCGTAVIGPQSTVANDNRAPVALAA